jgi:hypothetical protein
MPVILHVPPCTHAVLPEMIKNNRPTISQKRNGNENSNDAFISSLCPLVVSKRFLVYKQFTWTDHGTEGSDALVVG